MIPTIRLDEESFQEIFEKARKRIPILYPEWTNFNENDSGIALLELFSWLKEAQEFHLDQIGLEHEAVYLKLLGIERREICPARTVVTCYPVKREMELPEGFRFHAGDITFCSEEEVHLYAGSLRWIRTGCVGIEGYASEREWDGSDIAWKTAIFPEPAGYGSFLELEPDREMEGGKTYGFFFRLWESRMIKRNPVSEGFEPIVGIRAECRDSGSKTWKACELVRDDTCAFLYSGIIKIRIPEETDSFGADRIRFVFSDGEYDVMPMLSQIFLNPVELCQKEEENGRILGEGTGFPDQRFSLERTGVIPSSVELAAEDPEHPGNFEIWKQVRDFSGSLPEDRHFIVDGEHGEICFGDGYHGMPPEGRIRLIRISRTEGSGGNVKKGQIRPGASEKEPVTEFDAWNFEDVTGGADRESTKKCFERFETELAKKYSAVTKADYEELLKRTPGLLIEQTRVVETDWEHNRIVAAVKPWSEETCPGLSSGYRNNIMKYMEKKRILGIDLQIAEPEYIRIRLYADIELVAWYRDTEQMLKEKIRRYFEEFCSDFGCPVLYSGLYGFLDGMQGIRGIRSLTIDAAGRGITRNVSGDVFLPPAGLAVLDQIQLSVSYTG